METRVLRCPDCRPKFRVARIPEQRLGWVVREDYVGYLVILADGVKVPPKNCPSCGAQLEVHLCST